MGRGGEFLGAFFATVLFVGFLLVGVLANGETKTETVTTGNLKYLKEIERGRPVVHQDMDHNYMMSKRKVPNGPDPIHNRRAGDSTRPPGRA